MSHELNPDDIRTVEVRLRDERDKLLATLLLRVDPTGPDGQVRINFEHQVVNYREGAFYHPFQKREVHQRFTIAGALKDGEYWAGSGLGDTVVCWWDADAQQYVPLMRS